MDCIALSPLGGIYIVQRLGGKVPTRYIWQSDLPKRAQPPVEIDLPGGGAGGGSGSLRYRKETLNS